MALAFRLPVEPAFNGFTAVDSRRLSASGVSFISERVSIRALHCTLLNTGSPLGYGPWMKPPCLHALAANSRRADRDNDLNQILHGRLEKFLTNEFQLRGSITSIGF